MKREEAQWHLAKSSSIAFVSYMSNPKLELPYTGTRETLLVEDVDHKEQLCSLLSAKYEELPSPNTKKKQQRWQVKF